MQYTIIFLGLIFSIFGCHKNTKIIYTFIGKDLCHNAEGFPIKTITEEDERKFGIGKTFDFQEKPQGDSLAVSFKMIYSCCALPKDSTKITENQIIIYPKFEQDALCDCLCDYLFQYQFPNEMTKNRKLIISD